MKQVVYCNVGGIGGALLGTIMDVVGESEGGLSLARPGMHEPVVTGARLSDVPREGFAVPVKPTKTAPSGSLIPG